MYMLYLYIYIEHPAGASRYFFFLLVTCMKSNKKTVAHFNLCARPDSKYSARFKIW